MDRILIVEDEPRLASFLEEGLRANGFVTSVAADGATALAKASDEDFDLILLDLGLPDVDGLDVLSELRRRGLKLPVLILTEREELDAKVAGLNTGADDYVAKPFRFEELLARVKVRLLSGGAAEVTVLRAAGIELDLRTRVATVDHLDVELTAREFAVLETLMSHPGQVLSRDQLLSRAWGYGHHPDSNVVDVYIGYLRKKLGAERIETVRGMGYRLAR